MKQTFTLPSKLAADIETLKHDLGLKNFEATIRHLLQNAIAREKKHIVVRLYQKRQKTMRQCAELLNVDLEEMIDILREFDVSFNDDLLQQLETVNRLTREMRAKSASPARRKKFPPKRSLSPALTTS